MEQHYLGFDTLHYAMVLITNTDPLSTAQHSTVHSTSPSTHSAEREWNKEGYIDHGLCQSDNRRQATEAKCSGSGERLTEDVAGYRSQYKIVHKSQH